jgi:hypothetical protein
VEKETDTKTFEARGKNKKLLLHYTGLVDWREGEGEMGGGEEMKVRWMGG